MILRKKKSTTQYFYVINIIIPRFFKNDIVRMIFPCFCIILVDGNFTGQKETTLRVMRKTVSNYWGRTRSTFLNYIGNNRIIRRRTGICDLYSRSSSLFGYRNYKNLPVLRYNGTVIPHKRSRSGRQPDRNGRSLIGAGNRETGGICIRPRPGSDNSWVDSRHLRRDGKRCRGRRSCRG